MNEEVQKELISLWNSSVERCGYVMDTGEVVEAKNIASDPSKNFCMDIDDLIEIFCGKDPRKVVGMFHTHPSNSTSPSKTDIIGWPGSRNLRYWIVTNDGVFEWEKDDRGGVRPVHLGSTLASSVRSSSEG